MLVCNLLPCTLDGMDWVFIYCIKLFLLINSNFYFYEMKFLLLVSHSFLDPEPFLDFFFRLWPPLPFLLELFGVECQPLFCGVVLALLGMCSLGSLEPELSALKSSALLWRLGGVVSSTSLTAFLILDADLIGEGMDRASRNRWLVCSLKKLMK